MKRLTIHPSDDAMRQASEFVEEALAQSDVPLKASMQVQIAVDEVFSNIVLYSGASEACIECDAQPGAFTLRFTDDGARYNPLSNPDPDITLPAEEREIGGLGIFMVKKSMTSVEYSYEDGKNILTLVKKYE